MITIKHITEGMDLKALTAAVKGEEWGEDNEMENYDEAALRRYLQREGNVLLVAYDDDMKIAGTLLATTIQSPYQQKDWLYVDELDVKPEYRRQGIGKSLMNEAFSYASKNQLTEVWLGAIGDNEAANRLYVSLKPSEVDKMNGYTYEL